MRQERLLRKACALSSSVASRDPLMGVFQGGPLVWWEILAIGETDQPQIEIGAQNRGP